MFFVQWVHCSRHRIRSAQTKTLLNSAIDCKHSYMLRLKTSHSFIHFWHAPLWVRSAKRRHHSPDWTILSHVNCFVQGEVQWFQFLLGSLHPRSTGCPGGLLQFSKWEAVKICLASDSSGIYTMWPNRETRRAWTVAERCGCSVFHLTSLFRTQWYHLIPNNLCISGWVKSSSNEW